MKRPPKSHTLKVWPQFFDPIQDGTKPFEIRKNDRDFQVVDTLILQEWCPTLRGLTGRECSAVVTYITRWEQVGDNIVMGIKLQKP